MSQAMTNDDFDLAKFIKLMKMTTATIDGEALAAIRMANKMLRGNGHDWEALLRGKITIVNDPFGSIPTPPPAQAAPPPRQSWTPQPPPPPPPPQRVRRDAAIVAQRFATLNMYHHLMDGYDQQRQRTVEIDWQHHAPDMSDSDYGWLDRTARDFILQRRDPAMIQQFLDTCDFAPLTLADAARVNSIRGGGLMLHNKDYEFLRNLHHRHYKPTKGRGKAKRLI